MHVSDDQKYLSSSRLYACININTRKFKGIPEKLHHCQITKSDLHGDRIRGPTGFRKSSKFNLSLTCVASITQRFLVLVSTLSTKFKNTWHNDLLFGTQNSDPKFWGGGVLPEKLGGGVQHAS